MMQMDVYFVGRYYILLLDILEVIINVLDIREINFEEEGVFCIICMENVEEGEEGVQIRICFYDFFYKGCFIIWLRMRNMCFYCRVRVYKRFDLVDSMVWLGRVFVWLGFIDWQWFYFGEIFWFVFFVLFEVFVLIGEEGVGFGELL